MESRAVTRSTWLANIMMVVSIVSVCVVVPMTFILSGSFVAWLESAGIHATPNFAGGSAIAEIRRFETRLPSPRATAAIGIEPALAIRSFSVRKVAFSPWAGMGIEARVNLAFEFDGQLPDPQNSSGRFSATTIHVYIKAPGKSPQRLTSDKVAQVDFAGAPWDYQVIIDGLHDQARVYDAGGNLVARGLGLYLNYSYARGQEQNAAEKRLITGTSLTAALPMRTLGDPAKGEWQYYVLLGLTDSRHPSMMLHSAPDGSLEYFARPAADPELNQAQANGKPVLRPLLVSNSH